MNRYSILAFTIHSTRLKDLEGLFIEQSLLTSRLEQVKKEVSAEGIMYLATCNRLEIIFSLYRPAEQDFAEKVLKVFYPEWDEKKLRWAKEHILEYQGENAVKHLFEVASSLNSLVVGEREIITQVRNAYEWSHEQKLTDDFIRILLRKTIETAKKVYTDTKISEKPISVMSLACRKLQEWNVGFDTRVMLIGAGQTADVMVKYLSKHGFTKFVIFNRTMKRAKELAQKYNIEAYPLDELENYTGGFDVLITCVQSAKSIISPMIFDKLIKNEQLKEGKIIVDLGMPLNVDKAILENKNVRSITINNLKAAAKQNLEERKKEIKAAEEIIKNAVQEFHTGLHNRKIELAMRRVPVQIREIKENAISSVFLKEINSLTPDSKEVLEKVIDYLEKKYISIPMQMAKNILVNPGN